METLICEDCQEKNLDVFACPSWRKFCLACCGCDEHLDEGWTREDTKEGN